MGRGQANHPTLQVREVRDVRPGKDGRQDNLEDDHGDHGDRPLTDQRSKSQRDDEPDDRFELKPKSAPDHERVRRVQELPCVVGIIHPYDQAGRVFDLSLGRLRLRLALKARSLSYSRAAGAVTAGHTATVRPSATSDRIISRMSCMPAGSSPFMGSSRINS
jgi:hypothetical protein